MVTAIDIKFADKEVVCTRTQLNSRWGKPGIVID